ncbi:MAG: hypothetical protein AAF726_13570 [Planctomycetota bacterium]
MATLSTSILQLAASIGLTLIPASATAQDLSSLVDAPPFHTWNTDRYAPQDWWTPSPHQRGRLWYSTVRKVVEVDWFAARDIPADGFGSTPVRSTRQAFAVPYFPTDVVALSRDSILVAGKYRGTETVIEQWTLRWPRKMPRPRASDVVEVAEPTEVSRREVYRGDLAGQRIVHKMCRMRHDPAIVMLQFDDSTDLRQLDLGTGELSTIATMSGARALGPVPGLADGHPFVWTGDHSTRGYVYVFGTKGSAFVRTERPDTIVLCDVDRDGTLDLSLSVPVDRWDRSEFSSGASYVSLD